VDGIRFVYAGAASYASYFPPAGEYQAEANLDMPSWFRSMPKPGINSGPKRSAAKKSDPFRISLPVVDFCARDGMSVGPAAGQTWSPEPIDEFDPRG